MTGLLAVLVVGLLKVAMKFAMKFYIAISKDRCDLQIPTHRGGSTLRIVTASTLCDVNVTL